jgi:hypothetical protein
MIFTFEFFRIRCSDNAHATLDRVLQNVPDLDAAKVRAQSMFENMDLPQKPDGFRIFWTRAARRASGGLQHHP